MTKYKKKISLLLFCLTAAPKVFAEVNLLTGSYLLNLETAAGNLTYDSRTNNLSGPGFGWQWKLQKKNSRCKLITKDFLLTTITCTEINKPTQTWSFEYDSNKNLIRFAKDGKPQEKISYYPYDSVQKITTDTCSYEFKFQNGDGKNYQATETTTQCQHQPKQREITIFALNKSNNQAYVPRLVKKIGESLALQNNL